jgi:hypothetical protein
VSCKGVLEYSVTEPTLLTPMRRNWSRVKDTLAKDVRDTLSTQGLSWYDFSNHTTGNTVPGANSIETLHDRLHVYFGQGRGALVGHMADPSVAGRSFCAGKTTEAEFAIEERYLCSLRPGVLPTPL